MCAGRMKVGVCREDEGWCVQGGRRLVCAGRMKVGVCREDEGWCVQGR